MRRAWVGLGVVVVAALAAVAVPAGAAEKHTITGDVTLKIDGGWFASATTCRGVAGYNDIAAGTQVVVRNGKGKTLAVGSLADGSLDRFSVDSSGLYKDTCVLPLRVTGVPGSNFYSVEVSHRGEITYPQKKLERAKWKVHLTLGS